MVDRFIKSNPAYLVYFLAHHHVYGDYWKSDMRKLRYSIENLNNVFAISNKENHHGNDITLLWALFLCKLYKTTFNEMQQIFTTIYNLSNLNFHKINLDE